jgi:hypothetical protein
MRCHLGSSRELRWRRAPEWRETGSPQDAGRSNRSGGMTAWTQGTSLSAVREGP